MTGELYSFLANDHDRLESLLTGLRGREGVAADPAYVQFRQGLLRHIAIEERVLLPFAREKRGGEPLAVAGRIHLDHGALAALLAPTPTPRIMETIHAILATHNPIEEDPGGLYETCEQLAGPEMDGLLERIRSTPDVKLAPHSDSPSALKSMREAVERAGHALAR